MFVVCFFFQAEDGIRDAQESRGLGDVYKRQDDALSKNIMLIDKKNIHNNRLQVINQYVIGKDEGCLLYTSDAADDLLCVDLGGRRIIKKKNTTNIT